MLSPLPLNKCFCSAFPSLWICAVEVQPYLPKLRHRIFLLPSMGGTGTEHESREQNKTSSSNYSFPLKWIPREHWKPHHDPILAEKAIPQQHDPHCSAGRRAALYGDFSSERAVRRLEQKLETDWGPAALGWAMCGASNTKRDKLFVFLFFIFNDTHQRISNSSKGAPLTPATTWFKYNVWPAIPVLSLATNEIKKQQRRWFPYQLQA